MRIWSTITLERMPALWFGDVERLRGLGIRTAADICRAVREDGIHELCAASGIPEESLRAYAVLAEASLVRQRRLRRASAASAVAAILVLSLSGLMLVIQADLPFSPAEKAYASFYREYSKASIDATALLPAVIEKMRELEGESSESMVNLRLLSSALQDSVALDGLGAAVQDPTGSAFADRYADYETRFQSARAALDPIDASDPRIVFAHANTARAWMSRAETLDGMLPELGESDRRVLGEEVRHAEERAAESAAMAAMAASLPSQASARSLVELPLASDDAVVQGLARRIGEVERGLADLADQLGTQDETLEAAIDEAHAETRRLINTLAAALNAWLERLPPAEGGGPDPEEPRARAAAAGPVQSDLGEVIVDAASAGSLADCGFSDLNAAKRRLRRACAVRGLSDSVRFVLRVRNVPDEALQVDAEALTGNPLSCSVEETLRSIPFEEGIYDCMLVFTP